MMTVRRRLRTAGVLIGLVFLGVWAAIPRPLRPSTLLLGTAVGGLLVILGLAMARRFCDVAPILEGSTASGEAMRRIGLAIFLGAVFGAFLLGILVFVLIPLEPVRSP